MTDDPEMFMTYSMLEAILKSARKQAWDKGYEAGEADHFVSLTEAPTPNPYEEIA